MKRCTVFLIALIAGIASGVMAVYLLNFIPSLPLRLKEFLGSAIGISTMGVIEKRLLENVNLKQAILKSVIPALVGLGIAYVLMDERRVVI
jgi:uncharacterized membrane protein